MYHEGIAGRSANGLTVGDASMRPGHPFGIEGHEGHPAILVLVLGHVGGG